MMLVDLSKYKLAHFDGRAMDDEVLCHDKVMALAEGGLLAGWDKVLTIALIPLDAKLTDCSGDDWDDTPAGCNASGFYYYPPGTIILEGQLGGMLQQCETETGEG